MERDAQGLASECVGSGSDGRAFPSFRVLGCAKHSVRVFLTVNMGAALMFGPFDR